MTDQAREISVVVDTAAHTRGGDIARVSIPITKLSAEVAEFVKDIGGVLEAASAAATSAAKLSEVTVSATFEMSGKLSLLGTGVESKGTAGITFKFTIS